uniref:DUF4232 domain-containing protein n=1 Tax=Streptomyces sp. NBC_00049 TaxID=2903617 RepID=A0AAU2JTK5_9ACTN
MMDGHTSPGGASEEQALRGLLQGAVQGLEPSDGALERLRYAVPARRVLKRQVLVGAAAVALLAGTAIPAALHLTGGEGTAPEHSTMAGHGAQSGGKPGVVPSDPHQNGSTARPRATRSSSGAPAAGGTTGSPEAVVPGAPTFGATAGPSGSATSAGPTGTAGAIAGPSTGKGPLPPVAAPGTPGCDPQQLGVVGSARAPEADGKVYGSFKVTNVSARGCTVTGPDTVTAAVAAAPAAGVPVVGHTAGDPAGGLPDPSTGTPPVLLLAPNTAYEVRFAWVPGEGCRAAGPDTGAKPPQGDGSTVPQDPAGGTAGAAGATDPAAGTEPETAVTPPAASGVAVSHTPQTGAPTTQTTIPEVCGGTVYRTGPIPVESPNP